MGDTAVFRDSLFADAIHLNTEGAKVLTRRLVADLKTVIGR